MRKALAIGVFVVIALANTVAQQAAASQDAQAARVQWQQSARAAATGNPADLRARAIAQKLQARAARSANALVSGGQWSSLGPMPLPSDASGIGLQDYNWIAGRATAIAIDPNDASGNTVFIGGANGGVWKSINAGNASSSPGSVIWSPVTDNQPTLAIGALAIQPQSLNPNTSQSIVLAGTGETNSSADSYYGLGILRSSDGGQTWTLVGQDATGTHSFAGLGFSQIAFSTFNSSVVVAGAGSASEGIVEGLENPIAVNRGIYYSVNAGASWNIANITDLGMPISSASVTSVVYNAAAAKFYAAVRNHGFYSSFDGINWLRLATQPGAGLTSASCPTLAVQPSACPIYRGEIAVVPNRAGPHQAGEMYVWYTDANDADQGIWQSVDGGSSWTQMDDSGIINCGDLAGGCGTEFASDNLTLAAVPNGTATDLYAGATNVYKCSVTVLSPTCSGGGGFMNLTHAYGCSSMAKVYPGQHAIDFVVNAGTALGYFANNGGVYRALDGFTGLTTGTCGLSNQFDSLNATLGPMTQFVSLAQSSTDPNLILGGTAETGAPATGFAQSGGNWINVNAGNVGATAVNPANGSEWFLSTPPDGVSGVNLFRCANGINCHTQDFSTDQIADSVALGGDTGGFRLPFVIDPRISSMLIIGTCKVWRGTSTGTSFTLLSPDFENGGTGVCSGAETNLVRAIAAGGPSDANGNTQVIYAGTNGLGPQVSVTPAGGHVWVTTSADAGPASWKDRTSNINPSHFPISSIALDTSDATGQTAYAGIMGFHVSHIWKTTNAGISWSDFTANLPDAPVNSIVMDARGQTIYVGTDVGVFSGGTTVPNWNEVGPVAGQGFLPEAPVTALKIFNSGGVKLLRAATFGRGVWQWNLNTAPDFQIAINNSPQTIFVGQTAVYNGTLVASNGYNSNVNLSCTPAGTSPPPTCSPAPSPLLPSTQGATFSLSATGAAGDYNFNLNAVGTDAAAVTHNFVLALHVFDFNLSAPSPATVTVTPGATSSPIGLTVSAAGSFSGQVTLACSGLPANSTCNFQPSNAVSTTSANPAAVTITISTTSATPLGSSQVTLSASTPGALAKTQTLTLNVVSAADYTLAIANPSLTSSVNTPAVFNGTLTAVNGYSSAVAISCGTGAPPTCTPSLASIVPSAAGTPFTVSVSSSVSQAYSFNINAVGTDPAAIAHSAVVNFSALPAQTFDFTLSATPSSVPVQAGQSAVYTLDVSPNTGSFPSNVTFACSGLPALTTCSFNPTQIAAGSGDSVVTLTAATTAAIPPSRFVPALWLSLPMAGLLFLRSNRSRWGRRVVGTLTLALGAAISSVSCGSGLQGNSLGGSGNPGTPAGNYTINISVSTTSVTHAIPVNLTVTP